MSKKKKIAIGAIILAALSAILIAFNPASAFADIGWDATKMMTDAGVKTGGGFTPTQITAESLATWVQGITTWALGIAIVIFVLKVVLTAIDQMIFTKDGAQDGFLTKIPLIGAYSFGSGNNNSNKISSWKDVFIHFGKNVAIVAGAWILVQIVTGIILFAFGALTHNGEV